MAIVIAGSAGAADIGGIIPTRRIGRIGAAFEGLIQRGMVPLNTGVNVSYYQTIAL